MATISDFKKKKEEETARQSGQLAPEVDVTSGKLINPHNPEFITKRPWYLGESGPSLNHHAKQKSTSALSMQEADEIMQNRKKFLGKATTYRKGACENCGSMTHKKMDCVERPRSLKKSAKVSGMDIAPDESVVKLEEHGKLSFDGKRDLWVGYRDDEFARVVDRFNKIDEERRRAVQERRDKKFKEREARKKAKVLAKELKTKEKLKAKSEATKAAKVAAGGTGEEESDIESGSDQHDRTTDSADSDSDSDSDSDYDSDEEDDDEDQEFIQKDQDQKDFQGRFARQGGVGGAQMKETVRNLRIREDTAKYLRNLDPDSAYYDPKTRSMRENPLPGTNPEEVAYAGDNYYRNTGDTVELARMQVFAIEAQEQKIDIHPEANPTAAILAKKRFEQEQDREKEDQKQKILEMYGAEKFQKPVDARLRLGQTEAYVEYSRDGRIIKGAPKAVVRSKYQEDVAVNNHTSVWGSFYDRRSGRWGYKCCHATVRNSYCMGADGLRDNDRSNEQFATSTYRPSSLEAEAQDGGAEGAEGAKSKLSSKIVSRSEVYGENLDLTDLDEEKLKKALKKQKEQQKQKAEVDDRKRKYNSFNSEEVSKEDMEAYRMTKRHADDPMAKMVDSDTLLDG